jgi:hypothetical protein
MPRPKKTIPCQHCGKDFTQACKDQKYCGATCRFDHFFQNRDTIEERLEAAENENVTLRARVLELEAQVTQLPTTLPPAPKKTRSKTLA